MEAIAVIGAVSSIVNLVDFISRLLSNSIKIHSSAHGELSDHQTVGQITKDLVGLTQGLEKSI